MATYSIDLQNLDNFISVALGLKIFVYGIQDFILDSIAIEHKHILQHTLGGVCIINCSRKYGQNVHKWCAKCRSWRDQLQRVFRYKEHWNRVNWKEINTMDFSHSTPDSFEEIAKVFVCDLKAGKQGIFQDVSAIMSIFSNMNIFNIDDQIIADVERAHDKCFANNYSVTLDSDVKLSCLNCLIRLLKRPEIISKEKSKLAVRLLEVLRSHTLSDAVSNRLLEYTHTLALVRNSYEQTVLRGDSENPVLISANELFQRRIDELIKYIPRERRKRKRNDEPLLNIVKKICLNLVNLIFIAMTIYVLLKLSSTLQMSYPYEG